MVDIIGKSIKITTISETLYRITEGQSRNGLQKFQVSGLVTQECCRGLEHQREKPDL